MNVIFLDIDGVLNCVDVRDRNLQYEKNTTYIKLDIEDEKVKILSDICRETNSNIVITSTWRRFWFDEDNNKTFLSNKVEELFGKYDLNVYGFTPIISKRISEITGVDEWREYEINAYLISHPEVKSFCIIDDENYDLSSFENHLILTSDYINDNGEYGLLERHKEEVNEKLKEPRPKYSNKDYQEELFYTKLLLNSKLYKDSILYKLDMFIGDKCSFFDGMIESDYGKKKIRGTIFEKNNKYRITTYVFDKDKFEFVLYDDIELLDNTLVRDSKFSDEKEFTHEEFNLLLKKKRG